MYKLLKIFMALAVHAINGIRYMYHTSERFHMHITSGWVELCLQQVQGSNPCTAIVLWSCLKKLVQLSGCGGGRGIKYQINLMPDGFQWV